MCARAHVLILLGLLFLEISVHLGTPAIILSLQTFSKDDQIALLEKKSISSVIAYVPRARVLSFATNNSTGAAGSNTASGLVSSFFTSEALLPCVGDYILLT